MKKILTIILTLALTLGTVPLSAQEITISREQFIDTSAQIDAVLAKEFNNYTIKNPEAAYKEFREILKWKSKQYDLSKAKTYRDKQTYRNRSFMPSISQKEKYPNSTYFKKEGDFYRYAIAVRNAALETKTPLGYQDFQNHAENEMRRMFLQESKDENVLKEINLDNKRSPINDASYLAGYYAQNLAFTEAVREANLTLNSSDCRSPESKKDKDCIDASILGQYDYKLFESANQNVIKHISTIAPMMDRCLSKVLAPLQAKKIALQEIEEYLDEHSNLPWTSCGVDYEEARDLILGQTLTRAEAEDMIDNQGFGAKLLGTLDYISFSYYVNRDSAIEDFKMGIEDGLGDMSNSEIYREAQISDILSNSLNKVLTQIASNYIAYGQVFYYDVEGFSGKSDKFAETWSKVGTSELYQNMPIAKLARDAIMRSGRRGFQNKNLAKSMQEVRFESNAKSQVEILTIAADFVMDPTMLLAPIGETVKGLKLASKVAQTAPKTTAKVTKAAETVGRGVQTAKNAVVDSKIGRGVQRATQPVKQLKSKAGNFVYDAFDDWSDMGRHLDDGKTAKGLTKGAETPTDVVEDFVKTPTPKPEPTTATNPKELGPKLTGEFDDLVASAKPEETRRGIGFKPQDNVSPTSTTSGAPEGMRRQIGFGKSDTYIPDDAGKAVNGKGGVQDFTKGNKGPQARGPEGPNARNPYDVRNSAGGPDTPGTPQQDLSGLNQNISNTPTEPFTREESWKIYRDRRDEVRKAVNDKNYDNKRKMVLRKWYDIDFECHGAVEVNFKRDNLVEITKVDGKKASVRTDDFRAWLDGVPDSPANISQRERDAIKGYDDFLAKHNEISATKAKEAEIAAKEAEKAKDLMEKARSVLNENDRLLNDLTRHLGGFQRTIERSCTDIKTCNSLIEYLIDMRGAINQRISELHKAFIKSTGNTDVEAFYKALSDIKLSPEYSYFTDFFKNTNTNLRNFVTTGNSFPDFSKITDNILPRLGNKDLERVLKSDIPEDLKSLRQIATDDDWKYVLGQARSTLQKRLARDVEKLEDLLWTAERKAPELVEKIRNGAVPHITTLKKAGIDQKTANDIVDYYREIEKLKAALK